MVSLLKFAVSTLHIWEMGGIGSSHCAPLQPSPLVFSLGTFTLGNDRYCFALADGQASLESVFRHDVWPLTVLMELLVCAVVLGYLWSAFWGDRQFQFELFYARSIRQTLQDLRSHHPTTQVVRFRGGDRHVLEDKRVLSVFHRIGSLPLLLKFSIDNYPQFPASALTALLRGLGQKRAITTSKLRNQCTTTKPSSSSSKLQSLELHVEELTGNLTDLCAHFKGIGCSSLKHVKLYFWKHTDLQQTLRNEKTLELLLGALKHHPALQELELKAPIGPLPNTQNSLQTTPPNNNAKQPPITMTSPILQALIAVVETCPDLRRLQLNLWSRHNNDQRISGDHDTWYIAPLANALARPSFYTTSRLESLELLFASLPMTTTSTNPLPHGLATLERMVRGNYNITHLFVGRAQPSTPGYGDAYDCDNLLFHDQRSWDSIAPAMAQHLNQTRLWVTLNRLGRKRLLRSEARRQDWIQAILQDKDNVSITFCWIRMHPAVLLLLATADEDQHWLLRHRHHDCWPLIASMNDRG